MAAASGSHNFPAAITELVGAATLALGNLRITFVAILQPRVSPAAMPYMDTLDPPAEPSNSQPCSIARWHWRQGCAVRLAVAGLETP